MHEATGAQTIERMDRAGVDAAVLVSPWLNYLADASYSLEVAAAYPGRFAVVAPIDLTRADPAGIVDDLIAHPHGAGLRQMLWSPASREAVRDGRLDDVFNRMEDAGVPLCLALGGGTAEAVWIASRFPALPVLIDHLGLPASPAPPAPGEPFATLADILALSDYPNVQVKVTGMPALSHQPYPYTDLRDALRRLIDSFGPERVLWGTDWTRVHAFHTYQEGVDWIADAGLSAIELARVRGANAFELFFRTRRFVPIG
ncbi:MAG: amidohydrolase family protein [Microbacterium sp.]|nr:amidohydrolase family protein [Microbacterium sp.]